MKSARDMEYCEIMLRYDVLDRIDKTLAMWIRLIGQKMPRNERDFLVFSEKNPCYS